MSFFNRLFSASVTKTSVQVNNERLVAQARAQQEEKQDQQKAADVDLSVLKDADEILQVNALMEATQKAKVEAEKAAAEKAKQEARRVLMSNVLDAKSTAFDNLSKALKAKAEATAKAESEAELIKEAAASVEDELAAILNQAFVTVVVEEKSETTTEATHVVEEKSKTSVERHLPVPPAPPIINKKHNEEKSKLEALVKNIKAIVEGCDDEFAMRLANSNVEGLHNTAKTFTGLSQFEQLRRVWTAGSWKWGAPSAEFKALYAEFKANTVKELEDIVAAPAVGASAPDNAANENALPAPTRPGDDDMGSAVKEEDTTEYLPFG